MSSTSEAAPSTQHGDQPVRCVVLTGPTSVGKTAVALELAKRMELRVISADSMQVYRGMDIGTAKPSAAERKAVHHYGLDLTDPAQPYTVAQYLEEALPAIRETAAAGALPLVVGGTRLYLMALSSSFHQAAPPDPAYRDQLSREAIELGSLALHSRLALVDPSAGERIHPNDLKRVIRALEVNAWNGGTISRVQERSRSTAPLVTGPRIALVRSRDELYQMVESRTAAMLQAGWIEEIEELIRRGFGPGLDEIKAHGYRELADYLRGKMALPEAIELLNKNVRHYVRYQLGWIRQMTGCHVIEASRPAAVLAREIEAIAGSIE